MGIIKLMSRIKFYDNSKNSLIINENNYTEEVEETISENNNLHVKNDNGYKEKLLILSAFIIIIFELIFYLISLEGCTGTQTECSIKVNARMINKIFIFLFISSFLFSLILYLTINKNIKVYFLLLQIIIFSCLAFGYDTGSNLEHHGSYNSILFIFLVPIFLITIYVVKFIIYLVKNRYYKCIIFGVILIFLFILFFRSKLTLGCSKR